LFFKSDVVVSAPTASTSTNTTQIATTEFVQAVVSALVNSAPGTLDTLNELATALGDDPNFATTITSALAGKIGVNDTIDGGTI
jgi:phage-related tail fiber protein